ncbi:MAG: glycogen debranching protein [Bilophila wadsworthia]
MRKSAEFTMENDKGTLSVRLQELTVREVLDMCEQFGKGPLVTIWSGCCRGCPTSHNDLMDMTPGELEMLWEQVKEVNAAFFRIAGALGFGRVLEAFRAQLRSDLMEAALNGNSSVR